MNQFKKINLAALMISLLFGIGFYIYWASFCPKVSCGYLLLSNIIEPLEYAGFVLSAFFFLFLLLPAHYFEAWLKRIFSWAFPLAFISVLLTENGGGVMSFSKADIVVVNGILWGVITLIFVLYTRRKSKDKSVAEG